MNPFSLRGSDSEGDDLPDIAIHEQTDPEVLIERVCDSLKGAHSTPPVMIDVLLRTAAAIAVNNKCDEATWGQVKRGLLMTVNDSFDRMAKGMEARRPGA